jgi:hypothetical protein
LIRSLSTPEQVGLIKATMSTVNWEKIQNEIEERNM